jgi:3-deoxy-7-phosphoheptulonate synthase
VNARALVDAARPAGRGRRRSNLYRDEALADVLWLSEKSKEMQATRDPDASPATPPAEWTLASWRERPARQLPTYPDETALEEALGRLAVLPPLVTSWEVESLKDELAAAEAGERFLLQGGDCAERFGDCTADVITSRLKILLQMSLVLTYGLRKRVVRVGRFAGQFAKPRSSPTETQGEETLPSYRGDLVNAPEFTEAARTPDPERLLEAYHRSAMTLNLVRALTEGGFADLHHPEYWDVDFVAHSPLRAEYEAVIDAIGEALGFVDTVASDGNALKGLERAPFWISHEALHLPYEEALTRTVPHCDGYFNLGTHLPWVGKRTARLGEAHVEYARGLSNPVGLKVGPQLAPSDLVDLAGALDPEGEPGRLTLITRLGADPVEDRLPALIQAMQRAGHSALWCCDPMHGNTERTEGGLKTRHFDKIRREVEQSFAIHAAEGSRLGGLHIELTGEDVTECVGGARGLTETDLKRAYESVVDPRLNYEQALELAFSVVHTRRALRE